MDEEQKNVEETITITKKEYFDLRMVDRRMLFLEHWGVDNWEGYCDSFYPDGREDVDQAEERIKKEIFG